MAFITKTELSSAASVAASSRGRTVQMMALESRQYGRASARTTIFLSHSHANKQEVQQVVVLFQAFGINIYVDWADETMPEKPNATTAKNIKSKIASNDKFVLLATNEAVDSKWCNWELGIGDMNKYDRGKLLILPLADNSSTWRGNEYIQLYPRLERTSGGYVVIHPNGTQESILTWLSR